jgi:hypothetical protein
MANPNPDQRHLVKFQKGQSGNPLGSPRKIVTALRELGYKECQVRDTMIVLLALTEDELKKVLANKDSTILEKTVAGALLKGAQNKSLFNIELVMSRLFGRPRESQEIKAEVNLQAFTVRTIKVDVPLASSEAEVIETNEIKIDPNE